MRRSLVVFALSLLMIGLSACHSKCGSKGCSHEKGGSKGCSHEKGGSKGCSHEKGGSGCSHEKDGSKGCSDKDDPNKVRGRDVIAKGQQVELSGTLKDVDGHDWLLISKGKEYNIHFGPERYREANGIVLKDGQRVQVSGYILVKDVAVCTLTQNGKVIEFRDKAGKAAWSGSGKGKNKK